MKDEEVKQMDPDALRKQVSRIQPGDEVEVVYQVCDIERPPVSGKVWGGHEGGLYIGNSSLRYRNGSPAVALVRIVSHTPKRRPIKRGDVIESRNDSDRWDVPKSAIFRLAHGTPIIVGSWPAGWPDYFFPARCVDLTSDWEDES